MLAQMQTTDGDDPADVRMKFESPSKINVKIEEEKSADPETTHVTEEVGFAGFKEGAFHNAGGLIIGEVGSFKMSTPDYYTYTSIGFKAPLYEQVPVVIACMNTYNGADPAHMAFKNISPYRFSTKIEEWGNPIEQRNHLTEKVAYVAMTPGVHMLPDGRKAIVGFVDANTSFQQVYFGRSFSEKPVVFSMCQKLSSVYPLVTRQKDVTTTGFKVKLQLEQINNSEFVSGPVGYIAIGR